MPTDKGGDRGAIRPLHLAHVADLERRGILFLAGPFVDDVENKPQGPGMIIVRAATRDDAARIADADPYHVQGYRTYRLQKWRLSEGSFQLRVRIQDEAAELS